MLADLLDLVLPSTCSGCRAPGPVICAVCAHELASPFRHRPDPCPRGLPALVAAASYAGPVRALLLEHKEHGRRSLARPLGEALARAVAALEPPPGVLLVAVPSSPQAVRERGYDHARRLAEAAARALPEAHASPVLVPARSVTDQAGLDAAGRSANLRGALRARRALPSLPVLVVDDVVTTGATLAEAARALRSAGAHVHGAAVVAATQRQRGAGRAVRGTTAAPGGTR